MVYKINHIPKQLEYCFTPLEVIIVQYFHGYKYYGCTTTYDKL